MDRAALRAAFPPALDVLDDALRTCPDDRWEASVWTVRTTDPWVWPAPERTPIPERTEASIQEFSAFWVVAYHCLWFLDFYAGLEPGFTSPAYVRGGPEELPWPEDDAAPFATKVFGREVLLRYLAHGRAKVLGRLDTATDEELAAVCPAGHPHAGRTLLELLDVNLRHVVEHGGSLSAFARCGAAG